MPVITWESWSRKTIVHFLIGIRLSKEHHSLSVMVKPSTIFHTTKQTHCTMEPTSFLLTRNKPILSHCFMNTQLNRMLVMALVQHYGFERMARIPLILGLTRSASPFSTMILEAIPHVWVVQCSWLDWAFLRPSFRQSVIGHLPCGKSTSRRTLKFVQSSSLQQFDFESHTNDL
jgi:hypothetical protein